MRAEPNAKSHGLGGGGGALVTILRSAASAGDASAAAATRETTSLFIFQPLCSERPRWRPPRRRDLKSPLGSLALSSKTNNILRKAGKGNPSATAAFLCVLAPVNSKRISL